MLHKSEDTSESQKISKVLLIVLIVLIVVRVYELVERHHAGREPPRIQVGELVEFLYDLTHVREFVDSILKIGVGVFVTDGMFDIRPDFHNRIQIVHELGAEIVVDDIARFVRSVGHLLDGIEERFDAVEGLVAKGGAFR